MRPARGGPGDLAKASLCLCAQERRVPTKTQTFDDTVLIDTPGSGWMVVAPKNLLDSKGGPLNSALWSFDLDKLRSAFAAAMKKPAAAVSTKAKAKAKEKKSYSKVKQAMK